MVIERIECVSGILVVLSLIHGSATGFVEGGLCAGPGLAGFFVYHKLNSNISSGAALIRQVVRKWMCMMKGYKKKSERHLS